MHKQEITAKVSALKRDIVVPCTRLFEGSVSRINYSKGYSNKSITSNHSTEYAYSTIMYKLFELIILDVIAGNISTGAFARELAIAGADGIKVGQGPGSICTTRGETGIGKPQLSAIYECARAAAEFGVPVCADGGIKI